MTRILHILSALIIFTTATSYSQRAVFGEFVKDSINIGDRVEFILTIKAPLEDEVMMVEKTFLDSLRKIGLEAGANDEESLRLSDLAVADFELVDPAGWNDVNTNGIFEEDEMVWDKSIAGTEALYEAKFDFRFWDPGYNIMKLPRVVILSDGNQFTMDETKLIPLFVGPPNSLVGVSTDSLSLAPIKSILVEPANLSDYLFYLILLGVTILGVIAYILWDRYKKEANEEVLIQVPEVSIPVHEKALAQLEQLKKEKLWQKGFIKKYQSRLTHIVREYLEGQFSIRALEMTTQHIVTSLTNKTSLQKSDIESLTRILQIADLVKFAKATPNESIHESFMTEAISFVQKTTPVTIEEAEND